MQSASGFHSREEIYNYLDSYASLRKEESERHKLALGLIKSYVMETSPSQRSPIDVASLLHDTAWHSTSVGEEGMHIIRDAEGVFAFIDPISPRYLMLHTFRQTEQADVAIAKLVRNTSQLDSLWLAGDYFSVLWKTVFLPQMPDRFMSFKFEHLSRFDYDVDQGDDVDENESDDWEAEIFTERRASTSSITEQASRIDKFLPNLQASHSAFKAIKMMRIPATQTRGGFEFWSSGKVTHRSPSFREGREQILSVTHLYEQATGMCQ